MALAAAEAFCSEVLKSEKTYPRRVSPAETIKNRCADGLN